jgi:hypothetical protein
MDDELESYCDCNNSLNFDLESGRDYSISSPQGNKKIHLSFLKNEQEENQHSRSSFNLNKFILNSNPKKAEAPFPNLKVNCNKEESKVFEIV